MTAATRAVSALLVLHQRRRNGGCICGWHVLGASHCDHVASVLAAAGLLIPDMTNSNTGDVR